MSAPGQEVGEGLAHLRRANTCPSQCAEQNHPGREHANWFADRYADAQKVLEDVAGHLDAAKELAAVMDPEAFSDHSIENRSEAAAIQWAARRALAAEFAGRVLRSDWIAARAADLAPTRDGARDEGLRERMQIAVELTVQDVRAQRGDHIAGLVEDSFAAHFERAAALAATHPEADQ